MRSKKVEFRIAWTIYEPALARCNQEEFRSFGRYLTALALEDIVAPKSHTFSKAVADADVNEQDILIQGLLKLGTHRLRKLLLNAIQNHTS